MLVFRIPPKGGICPSVAFRALIEKMGMTVKVSIIARLVAPWAYFKVDKSGNVPLR